MGLINQIKTMSQAKINTFQYIFLVLLLTYSIVAKSQCAEKNQAFSTGEKLKYEVYYNWGVIWLNAGFATFDIEAGKKDSQETYVFKSTGSSYKNYDWIYKVRDYFESTVSQENFQPVEFMRDCQEGSYKVYNHYDFQHHLSRVITTLESSKVERRTDTIKLKNCSYDVLSMIYSARNINYSKYQANDKIPISILIDNELHDLYIRYLGKETITTKNGKTYNCIKFRPLLVEGTIFGGGEDMVVYVTDDPNRLPVLIEAKILVGSIKAMLDEAEGLRHPLRALVFKK